MVLQLLVSKKDSLHLDLSTHCPSTLLLHRSLGRYVVWVFLLLSLLLDVPQPVHGQGLRANRSDFFTRITEGSSGRVCENGFRKCLRRGTSCINNRCVCRSGTWRGDFSCYDPEDHHMQILNDPALHPFTREFAHMPVPCRYLVSHFKTTFTDFFLSTCEVKIHAYNAKWRGKIYVLGFDIALRVSTPITTPPAGELSIRVYGTGYKGKYVFKEVGSVEYRPDGPWNMTGDNAAINIAGSLMHLRHNPYDNIAFMKARGCGFTLTLRPADLKLGKDQIQVPGLSLSVDKYHYPTFFTNDLPLGLKPPKDMPKSNKLERLAKREGLTKTLYVMYRLFMGRAEQNHYNAAPTCAEVPNVIARCPNKNKRNAALKLCFFLLGEPRAVFCVDQTENGEEALKLYTACIEAVCHEKSSQIKQIQSSLRTLGCDSSLGVPDLDLFLGL